MLERLRDRLSGTDALIRAMRGSNRARFAEVFGRSTLLFLQVPPGCEGGLDPNMSQEEFLAHLRAGAQTSRRGSNSLHSVAHVPDDGHCCFLPRKILYRNLRMLMFEG